MNDPYVLSSGFIQEPPRTLARSLRFLGPGFVLSACIVGSGELIATTTLGARAGFVTLWVILVSCLVRVVIQLEFGKHAISTNESVMTAFNRLPGPRFAKTNWSIWTWLLLMSLKFLQLGGIVGGDEIMIYNYWCLEKGYAAFTGPREDGTEGRQRARLDSCDVP